MIKLDNNLTGLVLRKTHSANNRTIVASHSLVTGNNQSIETIDAFIGNSLSDKSIILKGLAQNTA